MIVLIPIANCYFPPIHAPSLHSPNVMEGVDMIMLFS